MTATVTEDKTDEGQGGVGRIARVIGPVVDIEFPTDSMPEMYNMLKVDLERQQPHGGRLLDQT